MAKNDLILLDSIIEERATVGMPSQKEDEVFEYLAYEQVLKEYDLSSDELKSGSVDGRNDGGIDAIYILANGHLIIDLKQALLPKSNANLEVFFFTCKHRNVFKQDPVNSIFSSLQEVLDFSKKNIDLDGEYNEEVLEKRDIFFGVYKKLASILESFSIKVIFASRGDVQNELGENVEARGRQIETLCKEYFSGCDAKFEFWGATELLSAYRKKADYSRDLNVKESLTHGKQMVVLASLREYFDFITYEDRKLRKYLFDSNVRDYMGLNAVNSDILETLNNPKRDEDFWWLNNGITILCSSAVAVGKTISISKVQIVNGLQTSESIYRYFMSQKNEIEENRVVLLKILPCDSPEIADDITRSTNNQTAVQSASLRATDKIQEDIERILEHNGLYYERRINYYSNQGISPDLIFSPLYLAAGYKALVLKEPYNAVKLRQRFMRNDNTYKEIFNEHVNLLVWPKIAQLMRSTDKYMSKIRGSNKSGERFLKKTRYTVSFLTVARLLGTFTYSVNALIALDVSRYTYEEVKKTWQSVLNVIGEDAINSKRWFNKNILLDIAEQIANEAGIANIKAIDKRHSYTNSKKKKGPIIIDEQLLQQVKKCVDKRTWSKDLDKQVAHELHIEKRTAGLAIKELLFRKQISKPAE